MAGQTQDLGKQLIGRHSPSLPPGSSCRARAIVQARPRFGTAREGVFGRRDLGMVFVKDLEIRVAVRLCELREMDDRRRGVEEQLHGPANPSSTEVGNGPSKSSGTTTSPAHKPTGRCFRSGCFNPWSSAIGWFRRAIVTGARILGKRERDMSSRRRAGYLRYLSRRIANHVAALGEPSICTQASAREAACP